MKTDKTEGGVRKRKRDAEAEREEGWWWWRAVFGWEQIGMITMAYAPILRNTCSRQEGKDEGGTFK
jgi:hypothetical protein